MSIPRNDQTLSFVLQKLAENQEQNNAAEEDHIRSLQWLAEFPPSSCSESLQILGTLDSYWEKYEKLNLLKNDGLVFICKVVQRQISYSQESTETSSLLISNALKMFKWCIKADGTSLELSIPYEFKKVVLEIFMINCDICTNLGQCSFLTNNEFINKVETYICKFLDLLKLCCFQSKTQQVYEDFQKTAQEVLSSVLKILLRMRDSFLATCEEEGFENLDTSSHESIHTIRYGLKVFIDLGCFAMDRGKDWVGLLNIAWKGVITLLQTTIGREAFSNLIDVEHVIGSVIRCTVDSLETAAEACKFLLDGKDDVSKATEFKRLCIPIKFFLINAVRIATSYPYQTAVVFREIGACGCKIAALRHELSKHALRRFAAEAIAETVEPSLFILLHTLLNSSELAFSHKRQILDSLIEIDGQSVFDASNGNESETKKAITNIISDQDASLQIGKITIFLGLLRSCREYGEETLFELIRRLDFIFQIISGSKVYAELFQLHVVVTQSSTKAMWECLYISILKALQFFFVTIADTSTWGEVETFLFSNILHPHALCRELILDLWCFIARHCETTVTEVHIRYLLQILSEFLNSRSINCSDWPVQMLSRSICLLVKATSNPLAVATIHELAFGEDLFTSPSKTILGAVLMKEHFPISSVPEEVRGNLTFSITKSQVSKGAGSMVVPYLPVEVSLCCLIELLIQGHSNQLIEKELSEIIKAMIQLLQMPNKVNDKDYITIRVLSLKVICKLWQDMQINEIRNVIVSLHDLVKYGLSESEFIQIKPILVEALAGLGEIPLPEDKGDPATTALWGLYHVILRERHWAIAHLALASFGYFAAHTSWNELWRFVPPDAALAYDAETGKTAEEDCFMSSLRQFLEKEVAISAPTSRNSFNVLQLEGKLLETSLLGFMQSEVTLDEPEPQECTLEDHMDPDVSMECVDTQLPSEIEQAMKMLQGGLSLLKEKLSGWFRETGQSVERQHHMDDQLSLLTDIIAQVDQDVSQYNTEGH